LSCRQPKRPLDQRDDEEEPAAEAAEAEEGRLMVSGGDGGKESPSEGS